MPDKKPYEFLCEDRSILLPVMKKYVWGPLLKLIRRDVSANTVTLWGHLCGLLSFLFMAVFPVLEFPSYTLLIPAVMLFLYVSLDNMDGAQARRTTGGSPLGEFLDHWGDVLNVSLNALGFCLSMQIQSWVLLPLVAFSGMTLTAGMWEQRMTGWLRLPPIGATEGAFLVILTFIFGAGFGWDALSSDPVFGKMSVTDIIIGVVVLGFVLAVMKPLMRVGRQCQIFIPQVVILVLTGLWYAAGNISLLIAALIMVLTNAFLGGRHVISRVTDVPYRPHEWVLLVSVSAGVVLSVLEFRDWHMQNLLALLVILYMAGRMAGDFVNTVGRLSEFIRPGEFLSYLFAKSVRSCDAAEEVPAPK